MPPSSKVITLLPPFIREEIERRLFENGFRDYDGLAQWVRGQGYQISDDSLWRYGYKLKQQFVETKWTMLQLRALSEFGVDEQDLDKALMRVAQTKALATLAAMEETEAADLNARTNLLKTVLTQQQRAAEFRARCQQPPVAPATAGPAATVPAIVRNVLPPTAPAVQQSQATSVSAPAKPEPLNNIVMPKPNDAAERQPRKMAVPAVGGPLAAPGGTEAACLETTRVAHYRETVRKLAMPQAQQPHFINATARTETAGQTARAGHPPRGPTRFDSNRRQSSGGRQNPSACASTRLCAKQRIISAIGGDNHIVTATPSAWLPASPRISTHLIAPREDDALVCLPSIFCFSWHGWEAARWQSIRLTLPASAAARQLVLL